MTKTVGMKIEESKTIQCLIEDLVREIQSMTESIDSPKEAIESLKISYKSLIEDVGKIRGRPLVFPFLGSGVGRGPYVELADGSVKMDLINGIGIHLMGHSHPKILQTAIRAALADVVMQGNLEPNREYLNFSKKLISLASKKSRLKYNWLSTCGTMANENALKMIRQKHTPARYVIAMKDAFAGRSTMMAEISDNPEFRVGLPTYEEVLRLSFFDPLHSQKSREESLNQLKGYYERLGNQICAFMFEPVQGEGGFRVPSREFLIPLLQFCKEHHIAIWADEIQTFSRTGELFAFEKFGIGEYIDVCTIAKTAQVAATLYTEEYNPKPGLISGTFSGSSVSLAVGSEILDLLTTEGFLGSHGRIAQIHEEFVSMLNHLTQGSCKGMLKDISGLGLMIAVTPFDGSKEKTNALLQELFKNGIIAFSCGHGPYKIRFLLPAVITSLDIKKAETIIEKSILQLAKGF